MSKKRFFSLLLIPTLVIMEVTSFIFIPSVEASPDKLAVTYSIDTQKPNYTDVGTNTTLASALCKFHVRWTDDIGLSHFRFGWNGTGSWINDSWTDPWAGEPTSGWSNITKKLNNTVGIRVEWRIWCNDTSNNYNDTGIQYLIVSIGVWTQKASMTYGRQYPSVGVVNGKIYAIGGRACRNDTDAGSRYRYNEEYDPVTDTWTTKTPKPTVGDGGATGVVNGKIHVIGQYPSGTENYMYDPVSESWASKASMPTNRWDTLGLVLTDSIGNDVIYVIGGTTDSAGKKTVEVYCPNNNSWITKAHMNAPRAKHAGCVYNGKIYVFSSDYDSTKTAEVYDPSTDTWSYISSSPGKVRCANKIAINGKIFLKGKKASESVQYYYDPETDTYAVASGWGPDPAYSPPLERVVIDSTCYMIGGGYWYKIKKNWAFTVTSARVVSFSHPANKSIYEVKLDVNATFNEGTNLTVKFYGYSGTYQGETTVWNETDTGYVELSIQIHHPLNLPVEIATLVLTGKTGIYNLTTFIMCRSHLMERAGKLDVNWLYASSTERSTIFLEIAEIDTQWPYAPP